jgi:hypothetical protein
MSNNEDIFEYDEDDISPDYIEELSQRFRDEDHLPICFGSDTRKEECDDCSYELGCRG